MLAIPASSSQVIISPNYDPTGLATVDLFDNPALGWLVDDAAAAPVPTPIITGAMPPKAPDTGAVTSPQWGHFSGDSVFVPDVWRGPIQAYFTWLATNGGAKRKVRGNFGDERLAYAMNLWSTQNAPLFNPAPF